MKLQVLSAIRSIPTVQDVGTLANFVKGVLHFQLRRRRVVPFRGTEVGLVSIAKAAH
jgi:hypothetical protein